MPQLESASYLSQIFWLIITFLSLWFFMAQFIVPRIKEIIEMRQNKIDGYLQKAENINKQALLSLERYEKTINKAKEEADSVLFEGRQELEKIIENKKDQLQKSLEQKVAENEYVLAKERMETMNAVDEVCLKTAELILNRLGIVDLKDPKELQHFLNTKE